SPTTNQTLTAAPGSTDDDGDTVTYAYQWLKNGSPISGATSSTLDLSTAGDRGDQIAVRVTPNDGTVDGTAFTSSAVTVANTPPVLDSVAIHQVSPKTDDVLTVDTASHDADSDTVTYAYQWRKNGTAIAGATGATLDLSAAGNGARGDDISVTVTPDDGTIAGAAQTSAAVTVANSPPAVTGVSVTPASPRTD